MIKNINDDKKLPIGWVSTTLETLGKGENAIVDGPFGSNLKTSDYIDDRINGVPVLTTKNLEGDYSDKKVRFITKTKFGELKRSQVNGGDILVAKIGSIGKTGIYPKNAKTAIIPANLLKFTVTDEVNFRFVYNYLNYSGFQKLIKSISKATAQPAFNVTKFRQLEIPVPPLAEQHRIVTKIEELFSDLDNGIESLKKAQAQLKIYRQAVLKYAFEGKLTAEWRKSRAEAQRRRENSKKQTLCGSAALRENTISFLETIKQEREKHYNQQLETWKQAVKAWEANNKQGKKSAKPKKPKELPSLTDEELAELWELPEGWCWVRMGNVIEEPKYGTSKKCTYDNIGSGVLRIPNIGNGIIDNTDLKFATFDRTERTVYRLNEGDLLTIRSNGSVSLVGKCAIISKADESFLYAGYLIRLRPIKNSIRSKYLLHALSSIILRNQIESKAKSTSGVNNINSDELKSLLIPICKKIEQHQIVAEIESRLSVCDKLEQTIEESLQKAESLRQSILKKAFEGKLVPQDPNDEPAEKLLEQIKAEKALRHRTQKPQQLRLENI